MGIGPGGKVGNVEEGSAFTDVCLNQPLVREVTSQLYDLAPKDLLWRAKINSLALNRFKLAKFNHCHFLPGRARVLLTHTMFGTPGGGIKSRAAVKPPGEGTYPESFRSSEVPVSKRPDVFNILSKPLYCLSCLVFPSPFKSRLVANHEW